MKKFFILLMVVCLILGVAPFSLAVGNGFASSFKAMEITDTKVLYERALIGNSAVSEKHNIISSAKLKDKYGKVIPVEVISTTQLLAVKEIKRGAYKNYYVTTSFAEIPNLQEPVADVTSVQRVSKRQLNLLGSRNDQGSDATYGATAYSTIYWSSSTVNGISYYDLTRSTGGWTATSGYSLTNKRVVSQAIGYYNGGFTSSQSQTNYPSAMAFDYTLPSAWLPIGNGNVGCSQYTRITRSGSSWDFYFDNFAIKNI